MKRWEFLTLLTSTAAAWPITARAQQPAMPVIGFLSSGSVGKWVSQVDGFRRGLNDTGFIDGQNVTIDFRWAEGRYDRLPGLAADLVGRNVNVIATSGGRAAALAAKGATSTIPIVFETGADAVADGLVASFARPGGNLTGTTILTAELNPKRLELLRELVPQAGVIAILVNPDNPSAERVVRDVGEAARLSGAQLHILKASGESEIEAAFASLVQQPVGSLLVGNDPFFFSRRESLVALARRYAVPAMYEWREFVALGGLISYGASLTFVYYQSGTYVGRILKGAKPADLPVMQPTKFELVINLKTAKTLGLAVPSTLLTRADEVIE